MKKTKAIYRFTLFLYYLFFAFALYCIGFATSVIFDEDVRKAEKEARERIVNSVNFRRGDILSCDGKPLATYYPEYTVFADFGVRISRNYTIDKNKVTKGARTKNAVKLDTFRINIYKEFAHLLAKNVGGNADNYYKELYNYRLKAEEAKQSANANNRQWYTENILKQKINVLQCDKIFNNPYLKKRGRNVTGIYVGETGNRMYPFGEDFAHSTIGVVSEETVSGIENMYNEELANGNDVLTTIDPRMQDICETTLRNKISADTQLVGGAIILMDVATGDIKAMANLGAYYKDKYSELRDTYNNATKATIEPGSTFKTVALLLALESGKVKLSDKFNTVFWRRKKLSDGDVTDTVLTVSRIIERSVNVGTGNMVDKVFNRNTDKFIDAFKALKIFERIDKLDETRPSIIQNSNAESMLKLSHGYQVKLAPIHILRFYNAIANNGVMLQPRLVRGLIKRATGEVEMFEPETLNKSLCSKSTLDSVRLTLSRVVGRGSAYQIAGSPYGIVGKTGTAKIWLEDRGAYETADGGRELASFCGYFPQNKPKYSCIVVLYTKFLNQDQLKKFSASSIAVPLFRKVSDKIYALYSEKRFRPAHRPLYIPMIKSTQSKHLSAISEIVNLPIPDIDNVWVRVDTAQKQLHVSGISLKSGIVPDVVGMGLRDAVFLLENRGLKVSYSGIGTVVKQSLEHGTQYNPGQKIYLTLGKRTS
jgi:cell division protein FtsI (penicillin-binding protein 3)